MVQAWPPGVDPHHAGVRLLQLPAPSSQLPAPSSPASSWTSSPSAACGWPSSARSSPDEGPREAASRQAQERPAARLGDELVLFAPNRLGPRKMAASRGATGALMSRPAEGHDSSDRVISLASEPHCSGACVATSTVGTSGSWPRAFPGSNLHVLPPSSTAFYSSGGLH